MRLKTLMASVVIGAAVAGTAWGWGATGHRLLAEEAMRALPAYVPAFLRSSEGIVDVGEYAREPDRWRGAGDVHDSDRTPAHFIDLDDQGLTLAGQSLDNLPKTRSDYEAALRAKSIDPAKAGYLPYATIDAYQQVIKDMAYWRILNLMEGREADRTKKAWYRADRVRREDLTLRDIGVLAHYMGDTTQPLHLSIHYNGWGTFPNPDGYTNEKIHGPLEGAFVQANVTGADLRAGIGAYVPCTSAAEVCINGRIRHHFQQVIPLYQLEKAGGFKEGDPRGKAFITARLAEGASDLRDALLDAWRDSKTMPVGYPAAIYDDFVASKVADPYGSLYGND
jgi:hypothetical protein